MNHAILYSLSAAYLVHSAYSGFIQLPPDVFTLHCKTVANALQSSTTLCSNLQVKLNFVILMYSVFHI